MSKMNSCSGCKFALIDDKKIQYQYGCSLNKSNALKNDHITLGYYDLKRFCIFKRPKDWEGDIELETAPRIGYLFILKDKDQINQLKENLTKVKNAIWLGISHFCPELQKEIIQLAHEITGHNKVNIICNFSEVNRNEYYQIDNFDKNLISGWTLVNIVGEDFDPDKLINKLKVYINDELKVAGLFLHKDAKSLNGMCFFNIYYKYYKGSRPAINPNTDQVCYDNFIEKISSDKQHLVKYWEEL